MIVPAGLTPADLDLIEPNHGPLRQYRVALRNEDTGESETHEVEATNCARAKGLAICLLQMRLLGSPLSNDVVRLDAPSPSIP